MAYNRSRLDVDERSELDRMGTAVFTQNELQAFEALCSRLVRLGEICGLAELTCVTSHGCPQNCGRKVPAGIPKGWLGSKYDVCPACARARHLVGDTREPGALDVELNKYVTDEEADKNAFFNAIRKMK